MITPAFSIDIFKCGFEIEVLFTVLMYLNNFLFNYSLLKHTIFGIIATKTKMLKLLLWWCYCKWSHVNIMWCKMHEITQCLYAHVVNVAFSCEFHNEMNDDTKESKNWENCEREESMRKFKNDRWVKCFTRVPP